MADGAMTQAGVPDTRAGARRTMVRRIAEQIVETSTQTGIDQLEERIRSVMERVPRHRFVPESLDDQAYADSALPIGYDQTISQPFIVGLMTQLAGISPDSTVLEVGAGSGYQAAILGELARRVDSIEIVPELADRAAAILEELGCSNVAIHCGDGFHGWRDHAPYDAILVTAVAPEPSPQLIAQLAPGGRMVLPLAGPSSRQDLAVVTKRRDGALETIRVLPVAFVPLTRNRGDTARSEQEAQPS